MVRLLELSASGVYKHQGGSMTTALDHRRQRRADLEIESLATHQASKGVHGAPRITAESHDRGEAITEKTCGEGDMYLCAIRASARIRSSVGPSPII